jgi:hypothetical protein
MKDSPWYERTSSTMWLDFFDLSPRYQLPVNPDTARMFRANLLYYAPATRLDHNADVPKGYFDSAKDQAKLAARRFKKKMRARKGIGAGQP